MDISKLDIAQASSFINQIPDSYSDIAVTNVASKVDLSSLGLGGRRVKLLAIGAAITYLAGDHTGGSALTTSTGITLAQNAFSESYFVSGPGEVLSVIAGSAGPFTLRVLYRGD